MPPKNLTLVSSESLSTHSMFVGIVRRFRDGHGVIVNLEMNKEILVPVKEMKSILHGDKVEYQLYMLENKPYARITSIVDRQIKILVGRVVKEKEIYMLAPEDRRYSQDIELLQSDAHQNLGKVVEIQIISAPSMQSSLLGRIIRILGDIEDPGIEIKIALTKFELPHEFSEKCHRAVQKLPDFISPKEHTLRIDLTDIPFVTIDGETAKDFDDAVFCQKHNTTDWRLLVAIADVDYYVPSGSTVDSEALLRATSVYFPRSVIPMLPEKLSNDLCSLNPHLERLVMVCDMVINQKGDITAYQFYPAIICSVARLTYTEVPHILNSPTDPTHATYWLSIQCLEACYQSLSSARMLRGALDFINPETAIEYDELGRIISIQPKYTNWSHRMIEESMLAANCCAADLILTHHKEALFRVHAEPSFDRIEVLQELLKSNGISVKFSTPIESRSIQNILNKTKNEKNNLHIHTAILRSMQQAVYSPQNIGHFGLAYSAYTHFTSPIRRYPDLLVHRVLKSILKNKSYTPSLPDFLSDEVDPLRKQSSSPPPLWKNLGLYCSSRERRAEEASRDVESWLKCRYMQQHLGSIYHGIVSSVLAYGLFVNLTDLYVDGFIHISNLDDDRYNYDAVTNQLTGKKSGKCYKIGAPMSVQIYRVNLDKRQIELRLPLLDTSIKPVKKKKKEKS
ncbi:MAG: ribonuclease R [Gammaproteobacteria bacterium]|nr:ribonuclease R [Gammaproteobacteria bacterium]